MPRYACGIPHIGGMNLYHVADHATDDAAVTSFRAFLTQKFPYTAIVERTGEEGTGMNVPILHHLVRVSDEFPLEAEFIPSENAAQTIASFEATS